MSRSPCPGRKGGPVSSVLFFLSAAFLTLISFGVQEFLPEITWAYGAKFILPTTIFLAAAVTVSYPFMLMLAFLVGFVWDARHLSFTSGIAETSGMVMGTGELAFGYSILLFGFAGSIMQGIRPLFGRGRFELPVLMIGIVTGLWLLLEYLLLVFRRGNPVFPESLWMKIGSTSLLAVLISPIILFILHKLAQVTHYEIRYEGLSRRGYGR